MAPETPSFQLANAPRAVPSVTRRKLLFGGNGNQVGWVFAAFGMMGFWAIGLNCELWNIFTFAGSSDFTSGQVTDVQETNTSENDQTIYEVDYLYTVDGREYRGASFGTSAYFDPGEPVSVEYLVDDPGSSRIEGMRRYRFSWWAIFVIIFPAIGLGIVGFGIRDGRRSIHILTHGRPTMGRMVSKQTTGVESDDVPQYEVFFEYTDDQGRTGKGSIKTYDLSTVEDDERERLLYDPANPASIVAFDALPGNVTIDARGELAARGFGVHYLILPLATVGVVVALALGVIS